MSTTADEETREALRCAEETIAALRAQLDGIGRLEEERQAELGQLQIDRRAELEELRVANVLALADIEDARQADLGQLQIDHRAALARAEALHRSAVDELLAAQVMRVTEIEAAHAEALGDARRDVEERVVILEAEVRAARASAAASAEQLEAQAREHRSTIAALSVEQGEVLTAERTTFEQMVSALQDELTAAERRVEEGRAAAKSDVEARGIDHAAELARLEGRIAELELLLASERGARRLASLRPSPVHEEPPPLDLWTPNEPRARKVHGSLADALRAAAEGEDDLHE